MARTALLVVLLAVVLGPCGAASAKKAKFWPFDSWLSPKAPEPPKQLQAARPVKAAPKLEDTKKALLATEVFMKKTAVLCQNAVGDDQTSCEKVAAERLFCTMFTRHEERFAGMQGEEAQREKCKQTDIMTTASEQAKNEREEAEALKNL
eukprot:gnl/TRDRNA2_/TRDRNA2_51563_c0_seq1.p1 gnl/TRDRNA2_/TRDRNA2_51563_c0~~gnl/TRDRNA2_/TRDRNA2_51563_c0_seq1.p1  ORF type:complete len:150 (+),score=52.31 gnl/TRDRNA2_/TRDRNA2_51563_c0_seq1:66-515(+)